MKIGKVILVCLVVFVKSVCAQSISPCTFDNIVNSVNYKLIVFSAGIQSESLKSEFIDNCDCEKSPTYNKIIAAIRKLNTKQNNKLAELAKEIDHYKTQYSCELDHGGIINLLAKKPFSKEVASNGYFNTIRKSKDSTKLGEFQKSIENEIFQLLTSSSINTSSSDSLFQKDIEYKYDKLKKDTSNRDYIFFALIGLILIIGFIQIRASRIKIKKIMDKSPKMQLLERELEEMKYRIRLMEDNLKEFKLDFVEFSDKLKRLVSAEEDTNKLNSKPSLIAESYKGTSTEISHYTNPEIFYLSWPNKDGGNFDSASATTSYKEGATIFKFYKLGSEKSEFEIDDSPETIQRAFQYPDLLEIVCEPINGFNHTTNKITTTTKGTAELQGKKWVVIKKAKIRYES